ncbi:ABC transporter ATPase [Sphingobacterium bovistauri]|uniref:ABC transporter ATPase n=1 Tax=Sphingobacterium bovistauri TaxID=2781959 RepID=A0ABS7Z1P5_9SPHI|nr:ABC transporter ATPase [Sphingobacterium bovistauri]MCA5003903.1 ABC transporter ATPase [Sphingobacterium bovistauri]
MSTVWIYQSDRFLLDSEVDEINILVQDFVSSWTAHGSALAGKSSVLYNLFLVLEVDEKVAGVTGCSIDKSVHFIKSLGSKFGIDFFNRMRVSYVDVENNVQLASRNDFEKLVKDGIIKNDTIVFNNLIGSSEELLTKWKIPFSESWHSKVF